MLLCGLGEKIASDRSPPIGTNAEELNGPLFFCFWGPADGDEDGLLAGTYTTEEGASGVGIYLVEGGGYGVCKAT